MKPKKTLIITTQKEFPQYVRDYFLDEGIIVGECDIRHFATDDIDASLYEGVVSDSQLDLEFLEQFPCFIFMSIQSPRPPSLDHQLSIMEIKTHVKPTKFYEIESFN